MPPTKTEVHSANKATLTEWLDTVYEEPSQGWDSLNVSQMKDMMIEALDDPELAVLLDPQEDEDGTVPVSAAEKEGEEEGVSEPVDLSRPNPKTDLYTGQFRP